MLTLIVICLTLLTFSEGRRIDRKCDGVILNNINHEKVVLKQGVDSPYQLAIDYDTNTLFFSFTKPSEENVDVFESAYINLKTNEYGTISGISGGFGNAVDNKHSTVYLGGNSGIYKFNYDTKTATYVTAEDKNIWQLFYKDRLYYTDYPSETAYFFKDGKSSVVPELSGNRAMLVAVDNNDNIFFSNSSGLFCHMKVEGTTVHKGDYTVNGLTSDINGKLYFSTPDAIYAIKEKEQQVEKIVEIGNIYGLAIAAGDDNIIYASNDSIVRLKPTGTVCFGNEAYDKKPVDEDNEI